MRSPLALPATLLALSLAPYARGDTPAAQPATVSYGDLFHSSAFTVTSENDKYFAGTDHHYTNGLKVAFLGTTRLEESPDFIRWVTRQVPTLRQDADRQSYKVGLSLGQDIFTPSDTARAVPDPRDRPYAAWLYTSVNLQAVAADGRTLRSADITVGMVGPAALGRQVQNGFHRMIGDATAQGWDHQLKNEPGLILGLERRRRMLRQDLGRSQVATDLIGHYGVELGNIRTNAYAGPAVRIGWHLPEDFGADVIRPGGGDEAPVRSSSVYLFVSSQAQAVARNIFLDGNSWRAGPSVDKRPVVGDLDVGLVSRFPVRLGPVRGLQLAYIQNYRTNEFYGQVKPDVFGSISMSVLF
jgi:lipid A 3-O-deacylase